VSRIVDLSVTVDGATQAPPAAKGRLVDIEHHRRGPGHWQVSSIDMLLHTGSHVDSTWHVFEDGDVIASTPLDRVIGSASIIDCTEVGPRGPVDANLLGRAARDVRPDDIIAIRTDWTDKAWGDFPRFYVESPYLTEDGADWLLQQSPKALVFDFFEEYSARLPDFTSEDFVCHRVMLGAGKPLLEQLTNLRAIGAPRFRLFAPFYKIAGTEGAPARFFTIL
jgi:kynurenine formamidase